MNIPWTLGLLSGPILGPHSAEWQPSDHVGSLHGIRVSQAFPKRVLTPTMTAEKVYTCRNGTPQCQSKIQNMSKSELKPVNLETYL